MHSFGGRGKEKEAESEHKRGTDQPADKKSDMTRARMDAHAQAFLWKLQPVAHL